MEEQFPVYWQDDEITQLRITPDGLYVQLNCCFQMDPTKVYVLVGRDEQRQIRLGIPVVVDGEFLLNRRLTGKELSPMPKEFRILLLEDAQKEYPIPVPDTVTSEAEMPVAEAETEAPSTGDEFIPVDEMQPFERLADLPEAYYSEENGQPGIRIAEANESSLP